MKKKTDSVVVSLLLIIAYFLCNGYGFQNSLFNAEINKQFWMGHLLYPISHANFFHLAANIAFLWMVKTRKYFLLTYAIAVLCSLLPCPQIADFFNHNHYSTMGFSGVLFAIVGISWGKIRMFRRMICKNKFFILVLFFIPNVNAILHIYCLLTGYFAGAFLLPLCKETYTRFLSKTKTCHTSRSNGCESHTKTCESEGQEHQSIRSLKRPMQSSRLTSSSGCKSRSKSTSSKNNKQ